jgi:phosphate transport system substrate-binding protein
MKNMNVTKKALLVAKAIAFATILNGQAKIVIKGSDTLGAKMIPKLAEAYENKNPGTKFEIAAEGSSTGIAAIIDGTADIGMSSRELKGKEKASAGANGVRLTKTVVALDAVAVIVNENNPISKLSLKDIERIFTDDVTDWSSVGGKSGKISAYTRNTSSGTYAFFQKFALASRDYGNSTQKMAGNEQIATEVANNVNGIGYIGLAYVGAKGIKVVAVEGVLPSSATANDGSYKLARGLNCFTNGKPSGNAKKFLDFVLTPDGQKIVASTGFVPAN